MIMNTLVFLISLLTFLLTTVPDLSAHQMDRDTVPTINGLRLEDLGKSYFPNEAKVPRYLSFTNANTGGTTSVRRIDGPNLAWKTQGYYQRSRDLGQVFNVPADTSIQLDAIVLRTGNSAKAILPGTPGAQVQMQIFEVLGTPMINDNDTPPGTDSEHGFTKNHRADDYLEGISYETIAVIRGGAFPDIPPTTQQGGEPGHLRYIRWNLEGDAELKLEGGKRYAFMVGFVTDGPGKGFSLGNTTSTSSTAAPALRTDPNGVPWWSIRREGDGTLPPTQFPGENPPTDENIRLELVRESLFEKDHECKLSPTTDGFPDVDTYRTHEFYIEVINNCTPAGTACDDGDDRTSDDRADGNCNCFGTVTDGCRANGRITYRRYENIGGTSLNNLTSNPVFPDNFELEMELEVFEAPSNVADNYGATLTGYICAPLTGSYTFWVAGDDHTVLNLSTDTNPANKRQIAHHNAWTGSRQWDKFTSQQSAPIYLEAGKSYYIEALVKEAGGGDHLAVGWQLPTGVLQRPIPGDHLGTIADCPTAGIPCDDGNPNTIDDRQDGHCNCTGTNTCPQAGTGCDDGNPNTINDVEDGNCGCAGETAFAEGLLLEALGKNYVRDPQRTPEYLYFDGADLGGSTSVRRVDAPHLKWKHQGYFQRNRDLGQTFYIPEGEQITLDAIVLRTGNSSSAINFGALVAEVYLQLFEVTGEPVINNNGTPAGSSSTHGFTKNHRADDYLEGVDYHSILAVSGGFFPAIPPTGKNGGERGHLQYIRWDLAEDHERTLEGGKRYAFMVGFRKPAQARSFTLANVNRAAEPAAPTLATDANGHPRWSIRREGDGTLPPTQYPGEVPPASPPLRQLLRGESLFQNAHPYLLSPTTDGFPDVDTYRTLEFYVETRESPVTSQHQMVPGEDLQIYPNPVSEDFHIEFHHQTTQPQYTLTIKDLQGRILQSRTIHAYPGKNSFLVKGDELPPGVAIVTLINRQRVQSAKVVIH